MSIKRWMNKDGYMYTYIPICTMEYYLAIKKQGLPRLKNLPANAGNATDASSIPGLGRSSGVRNGTTPVFLPGKSMDRGACWATVHGAAMSWSTKKENEIMPFAVTQMDLEIIILSEVSQTEKEKYHTISLLCGILKKFIYLNLFTKQK